MSSFILGIFSFLIFILSVNGTMALRNVLAVTLLISLVIVTIKGENGLKIVTSSKEFKWIAAALVVFVLYIFFHSVYLSHEMAWSLSEFKSHIFYPLLYFLMGINIISQRN